MKSESLWISLIAHPLGQVAMIICGAAFVWWHLRAIRNAVKNLADRPKSEQHALAGGMLAQQSKILLAGGLLSALGACMMLSSSTLITRDMAMYLFASMIFVVFIPGAVYINWRIPFWLSRWLLH